MMPIYRQVDSYPFQSEKMPFDQQYQPCLEAVLPRMGMMPVTYQPWPSGGSYGYPIPHHACCNHHESPAGYYSPRAPYPYLLPVAPSYCGGIYPAFPGYAPGHYVSPPYYSMENPRYEYDKNAVKNHHCCGCPNHNCNQKEERNVKTGEQEPDVGKRGGTLVPLQLKNYPFPLMWVPAEYLQNEAGKRQLESEIKDQGKIPRDMESLENSKSVEQGPKEWDAVDLRSLGPLILGGDGKRSQSQQDDAEKNVHEEKEDHRKTNSALKFPEQAPYSFKVFPAKLPASDNSIKKYKAIENDAGSQIATNMLEKPAHEKCIPVKQMEHQMDKNIKTARKVRDVPVKHTENKTEVNTSPPKTSKLPPVCLRVDPLPRRKTGNSNSRSPSPPTRKGDTEKGSFGTVKASDSSHLKENIQQGSQVQGSTLTKEREQNQKMKTTENRDGDPHAMSSLTLLNDNQKEISSSPTQKHEQDSSKCESVDVAKGAGNKTSEDSVQVEAAGERDLATPTCNGCKAERKFLSAVEASVLIQSAYRGFEVRKWEPLKKLREIAALRKQVVEVRNCIQALESSSELKKDDRQKVVIEEMIMNLLLKLDTIQGLHPSLREIRKSLARELTTLQEKLDSLVVRKAEDKIKEGPTNGCSDDLDNAPKEEQQGMEVVDLGTNSSKCSCGSMDPLINLQYVPDKEFDGSEHRIEQVVVNGAQSDVVCSVETGQADDEELDVVQVPIVDIKEETNNTEQSVRLSDVTEGMDEFNFTGTEHEKSCRNSNEEGKGLLVEAENATVTADLDLGKSSETVEMINDENEEQTQMEDTKVVDSGEVKSLSRKLDSPPRVPRVDNSVLISENLETNSCAKLPLKAVNMDIVVPALGRQEQVLDINGVLPNGDSLTEINEGLEISKEEDSPPSVVIEDHLAPKFVNLEQVKTANDEVLHDGSSESTLIENGVYIQNQLEQQPVEASGGAMLTAESGDLVEAELPQPEGQLLNDNSMLLGNQSDTKKAAQAEASEAIAIDRPAEAQAEESVASAIDRPADITETFPSDFKKEAQAEENEASAIDRLAEITETEEKLQTEEADVLLARTPLAQVSDISEVYKVVVGSPTKENDKLKEMMEKLIQKGEEQLTLISDLTGRVKDLEKKLSKKTKKTKKEKARRYTRADTSLPHAD